MKKYFRIACALPVVFLFLFSSASAATCTKTVASGQSIQSAMSSAVAGEVICVRAGTYAEALNITKSGTAAKPIILQAYPGEKPVIDGQNKLPGGGQYGTLVMVRGSYIILDGFEFKNSSGEGIQLYGAHNTVRNSKIHHMYDVGIIGGGDYSIIEYNEAYENGQVNVNGRCNVEPYGDLCYWPNGIGVARDHVDGITNGAIIRGNISHDNWGEGIDSFEAEGTLIENNISYNNFSVNLYISDTRNAIVRNNLVYNINSTHVRSGNPANVTIADEVASKPRSSNVQVTNNIVYGADICEACWTIPTGLSNINVNHNTIVNGSIDVGASNGTNITQTNNCTISASQVSGLGTPTAGMLTAAKFAGASCTAGSGANVSSFSSAVGPGGGGTTPVPTPTPSPVSTKFVANDRVQVSSGPLNVRNAANGTTGTILGAQVTGALGTVVGGPISQGGYNWWQINYDTGADGWSVEGYLVKYVSSNPTSTPAPTPGDNHGFRSLGINFWGDWEQGITGSNDHTWQQIMGQEGFTLMNDGKGRQGSRYVKVEVSGGSDERSEVIVCQAEDGSPTYEETGIVKYSFSVKFDKTWTPLESWGLIFQIHTPDTLGTNPAFALLPTNGGGNGWTVDSRAGDINVNRGETWELSDQSFPLDTWIDFQVFIKYAKNNTGFIIVDRRTGNETSFHTVLEKLNIPTIGWSSSQETGVEDWDHQYARHGLYGTFNGARTLYLDGFTREVMTGTTPPPTPTTPGETTPPSIPSNLTATALTYSKTSLTWTASTDNTAVAGYKIFRNGTQVGTSNAAAYTDTGLTAETNYSYTVAAYDAAGNTSALSGSASVKTKVFTPPPPTPVGLTATATSPSQIKLNWTAATSTKVTGYNIFRNSVLIALVTNGTTYTNNGLTPSTNYTYTIASNDITGGVSSQTESVNATTLAAVAADTQAPTAPSGLTAVTVSSSRINLSWTASTDTVGVTGYSIFRDGINIAVVSNGTSYVDADLSAGKSYAYTVAAFDAIGNTSEKSSSVSATTFTTDAQGTVSAIKPGDRVYTMESVNVRSCPGTGCSVVGVAKAGMKGTIKDGPYNADGSIWWRVAFDNGLNGKVIDTYLRSEKATTNATPVYTRGTSSRFGRQMHVGTMGSDVSDLQEFLHTLGFYPEKIISGYLGALTSKAVAAFQKAKGLSPVGIVGPQTLKKLNELAEEGSENKSSNSLVYTPAPSNSSALTVKTTVVSPTRVDLSWGAVSGAVGYTVKRDGNVIATVTGTTYSDTAVKAGTYIYIVSSNMVNGQSFASAPSQVFIKGDVYTSVSDDLTPPSIPTNLVVKVAAWYQIDLTWSPSTDNDRVVGYKIYRDGVQIGISATTSYSDISSKFDPTHVYSYTVSAFDFSGNESGQSASSTGQPPAQPAPTPVTPPTPGPGGNDDPYTGPMPSCDEPAPAPTNSTVVTVPASNGSDDTVAFNAAIAQVPAGGTVRVPAGTYLIDATRHVNINKSLTFKMETGAILKAKPNAAGGYQVILVTGSNVNIIGGTLQGERNQHLTPGNIAKLVPPSASNPSCLYASNCYGQWGHGLEVRGSNTVFVSGVLSKDMWGDGFNVSGNAKNVRFCSIVATGNRRQGMSIINGSGIVVKNSVFTNTVGHAPQCGFDVEPNANQIASNIQLLNSQFTNNENCGLSIYAGAPGAVVSGLTITGNTATGNRGNARFGYILDDRAKGTVFTNNIGGSVHIGVGATPP